MDSRTVTKMRANDDIVAFMGMRSAKTCNAGFCIISSRTRTTSQAAHVRRTNKMMDVWTTRRLQGLLCLDDFEPAARSYLPRPIFGYIAGAVETDWSLDDNRAAFAEYGFVPRMLVDVSKRSQQTTIFGHTYAAPFGIAPIGMSALYAYRGDLVLAAAGAAANIPMIMSGS